MVDLLLVKCRKIYKGPMDPTGSYTWGTGPKTLLVESENGMSAKGLERWPKNTPEI